MLMNWHGSVARKIVVPILEGVVGRRNLVRMGRLISMEARLDGANDMVSNGELMVQDCLLNCRSDTRDLMIFDVGANVGEWTQSFLNKAVDAAIEVHLFEPASVTFQQLCKNLAFQSGRVVLVNDALSNTPGTAEFVIVGSGLGINSLHADRATAQSVETVRLNTVDEYCRQRKITRIDMMKIDAEGHDMAVLQGASGMFANRSISIAQFEYNQRWIDSRHFLKDAFELLKPLGYCLGKVTPRGIEFYSDWHFELESFREGNYLACTPERVDTFPKVKWWHA